MRPDTPQLYEDVLVENIENTTYCFLDIKAWTQFFEGGNGNIPKALVRNISISDCKGSCMKLFDVTLNDTQFEIMGLSMTDTEFSAVDLGISPELEKIVAFKGVTLSENPGCPATELGIDVAKIM